MKQYLIVKVAKDITEAAMSLIPLPGIFTRGVAEQSLERLRLEDPGSKFLMQEVGMA